VLAAGAPPIGFIVTGPVAPDPHVHQLSVDPAHVRRDVGSALLEGAVVEAVLPVPLASCDHVPSNAPWYLPRGFERFARSEWSPELGEPVAGERPAGLDDFGPRVVLRRPVPPGDSAVQSPVCGPLAGFATFALGV
jgi:hypothetical protein